jgi:exoribonuclease R
MTGMAAAALMLEKGIGLLRTLPPADEKQLARLRRVAEALGIEWREPVGELIRSLDPLQPRHAALLEEAATLLRGAGYVAFDGTTPEDAGHAGVGAPYAHVTAPLRRLADRYATAACLADDPPGLAALPEEMARGGRAAGAVERACVDLVEALVLAPHVGERFPATVIDDHEIQLAEPAVRARCEVGLEPGVELTVRLVEADPAARHVRFEPA